MDEATILSNLLGPGDPDPVSLCGPPFAEGPLVLLGDHAGRAIPAALGDLGLDAHDRERHIAWDIGSHDLGRVLSQRLGAPFVSQSFSRLVIDCNRDPEAEDAIPQASDGTQIPGNQGLSVLQRAERVALHSAYHAAVSDLLDRRVEAGLATVLVSLHSFTARMAGQDRPWEIGVLHGGPNDEYARRVLASLLSSGRVIGDNEPYVFDETDYTIPRHAFSRAIPWVEIEVRQDLLGDAPGVEALADLLGPVLTEAV